MDDFDKLQKADKIGNIIEYGVDACLGVGTEFLVHKAVEKIYEPQNIMERILLTTGELTLTAAITVGAGKGVHRLCHPFEEQKKQELVNRILILTDENNKLSEQVTELGRIAREEGDLLLRSIEVPDDIPDNGLNMSNFKDILGGLNDE